jgi:hypothetical protein
MNLPTVATIRFRPDGVAAVDASLRIGGNTYLRCHTYDDIAPILSVDDHHVQVSITVPDPEHVTAEDLDTARCLAEVVAEYIAGLEARLTAHDTAAAEDAAA